MIVVGIDPSLTGTGIATPDASWTVRSEGDDRLAAIYDAVRSACDGPADLAVVEDLPTHAQGAGKTGMAQGVARLALIHTGVPYALVTPATVKKYATGKGNATKPDMRMALYQRAGIDQRDDNQVDAWWLRALGMQHLGEPVVDMPVLNIAALHKIHWPGSDAPSF